MKSVFSGLYPEGHQIVDNHMVDRDTGEIFDLDNDESTGKAKWWAGHVPIWSTLTHQGYKVGLHHWSRCDIPFSIDDSEVKPLKCVPYDHENGYGDDLQTFKDALDNTFDDLDNEVLDVSFVYYPDIDTMGHRHGPDGEGTRKEVQGIDVLIYGFLLKLQSSKIGDKTNVIIGQVCHLHFLLGGELVN